MGSHSRPAIDQGERHRYGEHYTPTPVARLLAALAVKSHADRVLDPACGDGRLLFEALRLKRILAGDDALTPGQSLFGFDRSAQAARLAGRTGALIRRVNFFDVEPGSRLRPPVALPAEFDAVIGNPPYIRQEVIGRSGKQKISQCLARGAERSPGLVWPRWSLRSDVYIYFFAHAARFLSDTGRLVFLTASSWLDSEYGAALREFLLGNFRIRAIVESACESFFPEAAINTAITVLQREPDANRRARNTVRFIRLDRPLAEIFAGASGATVSDLAGPSDSAKDGFRGMPEFELALAIESGAAGSAAEVDSIRAINQGELEGRTPGESWGKYLRADEVFFRILKRGGARLHALSTMAQVRFGVKTGANEFFYLSGGREGLLCDRPDMFVSLDRIATIRRGLTTGANGFFYLKALTGSAEAESGGLVPEGVGEILAGRGTGRRGKGTAVAARGRQVLMLEDGAGERHLLESDYLQPIIFSLKEIPGILLDTCGDKRMVFHCASSRAELAGTHALRYIRHGEVAGYHLRATCASREPWYAVAHGVKPAPLIFPSKVGQRWLVAVNRAEVIEDKKLFGVFPRRRVPTEVLAALLNSTWARYYAEVTCRQMTGAQAIADIDVGVAGQMLLPDPRELPSGLKLRLRETLQCLARRPVLTIFEEVKREDRRRLDDLTLLAIGFRNRAEREQTLDRLYRVTTQLVRDRMMKAKEAQCASVRRRRQKGEG